MTGSTTFSSTTSSGLGFSGLSSGIDTSALITKLMTIESAPQTALKAQLSTAQTHTTALQTLNGTIATLATAAATAASSGALTSYTSTSSDSSVTATADKTASAGSVSFTVTQLAQAQVSVTNALTTWPDTSSSTPTIGITTGSGSTATTKTVTAASGNLDDVVAAINGSGAGVTATKIQAGTDANGKAQYRLQLRSSATGAAGAFTIQEGSGSSATTLPTTTVQSAQDATVKLYAGTGAEQSVTSSSNTFTNLLTGVNVTVSAVPSSTVTVTTAADATAATTSAQSLVTNMSALFSSIATSSAVSSSTSDGSTSTSGGVFTGDIAVRQINDSLTTALTQPINNVSPSSIGIELQKDGTVTFDQSTFAAAMAKDPAGTTTMYQTIAGNVAKAASAVSDPYSGSLTTQIGSETTQESSLTDQISDWATRLTAIQAQYQSEFDAMETALNTLQSQSSYLTSQITGLTSNYESST